MGTSSFYGLQKLAQNENLPTNDYSFGNFNIEVLDRFLYKINSNIFDQSHPIENPVVGPSLALSSGGSFPANKTLRYKYSYVDSYGNETAGSPETVISTPPPVSSPNAPFVYNTASGGTLTFGTYFYALSAYVTSNGNETLIGSPGYVAIASGTANLITVVMPTIPAGADGINIYKRGPGQSIYYYLGSVAAPSAGDHYVDNGGTAQNTTRTPSNANTTNATNTVTISLPSVVPLGYTWKIYRSETTDFASSVLVHVVEETSVGSGIIVADFEDTGLTTTIGHPQTQNLIYGAMLDAVAGRPGGATPGLWDDFATPTQWDTFHATPDHVTNVVLHAAASSGNSSLSYVTANPQFLMNKTYAVGFKMTFDDGPFKNGSSYTSVRICEVRNNVWNFKLHLDNWGGSSKEDLHWSASVEADGDGASDLSEIGSDFGYGMLNAVSPQGAGLVLPNASIMGGGDPVNVYITFDFDTQAQSITKRWDTKPQVKVYVNGFLVLFKNLSSGIISIAPTTVTTAKIGFLGFWGHSDSPSYTSDNALTASVDYAYTEQIPKAGRAFDPTFNAVRGHIAQPNAHPVYQNTQFKGFPNGTVSVASTTTLAAEGDFVTYISDLDATHYEFQGLLKFAARTTEDVKFKIQLAYDFGATPYLGSDLILNYQVLPYDIAVGGVAGQIYTDSDVVVLSGAGASTYRMVEIRGFIVHDSATPYPLATGEYGLMRLQFSWAKNANDATPGEATLAAGTFFKTIHTYGQITY